MKLVVVGGGIAGLAAAHHAVEVARARGLPLTLRLLEARERVGGTIASDRVEGFLIEQGPDSFLSDKPWALALCQRVGLEPRLVRTDEQFRKVYVWRAGRLHPLPDGFQLLAPTRLGPFLASSLFSWRGKARMAMDLVLPRGGAPDESLGAFVRRRLGAQALERVAQPLVAGIYTADPDELSLAATLPRFVDIERRDRSLILGLMRAARRAPRTEGGASGGRWSLFVTPADGMAALVDAVEAHLPAGVVECNRRVVGIERSGPAGAWRSTAAPSTPTGSFWRARRTSPHASCATSIPRSRTCSAGSTTRRRRPCRWGSDARTCRIPSTALASSCRARKGVCCSR